MRMSQRIRSLSLEANGAAGYAAQLQLGSPLEFGERLRAMLQCRTDSV